MAAGRVLLFPKVVRPFPCTSVSPVTLYRNYFLELQEEIGRPKGVLHYQGRASLCFWMATQIHTAL